MRRKSKLEIVRGRSKAVHWRILSTATEAWSVYSWWQTGLGSGAIMGMDSSGQIGLGRKKQAASRLGLAIRSGLVAKTAMRLSLHRSPVTLAMTVRSQSSWRFMVHPLHTSLGYRFCSTLQGSTCPSRGVSRRYLSLAQDG